MSGLKSRLLIFAMRNSHLLRFHLKRDVWDWNTSIPKFSQQCEAGNSRMKLPDGISIAPVDIPGVTGIQNRHAEWLFPPDAAKEKVILYTLGGGYVSGSCNDHRVMVAKITAGSGVRTLLFDHRLAPEDPYPAALEDALTAYRWLLAQGVSSSKIAIVGESAGGGLCLATLLALRDQGTPLPAVAVALPPWTDLTCSGESYQKNAKVCLAPAGMATVCSKYYAGENDPRSPRISPLFGDLHGLPPTFICVGSDETMLDDSISYAEKAKAAGVNVTLRVWDGMFHCFPLMAPIFPESTQALDEICTFINNHFSQEKNKDD
ncbi:alpha/beta hydrolase [bacterium]|nr:MAG: alpha/beta hydrolase [bacterium]